MDSRGDKESQGSLKNGSFWRIVFLAVTAAQEVQMNLCQLGESVNGWMGL